MRGFLARAGHALGRLTVSLGYGWGKSRYDDHDAQSVVCLSTRIDNSTLETVLMSATACLATVPIAIVVDVATEPVLSTLAVEPVSVTTLETELFDPVVRLSTHLEEC